MKRRTGDDRERSLMGRAVWRRAVAEVHQLGLKQRIVYTVKSNRQLGQDAGTGAIGRGRGWACVGVRAIGGDALAMQVHACARASTSIARLVECCAVWDDAGGWITACFGCGSSE
jgi:hypothetical protein